MAANSTPLAARLYVAAIIAAGAALLVYVTISPGAYETDVSLSLVAVMALAVMAGEIVTEKVGANRGDVAPSNTFAFALLIVAGPAIAILAMFVACTIADLRDRKPPVRMAFNSSQYTIAIYLSYLTLAALTTISRPAHFDLADMLGLALAGAVFYGVNIAAVAIVLSLHTGTPFRRQFRADLAFHSATEAIPLGIAPLAVLAVDYSPAVLPLIVLPLIAINRAGRQAVISERLARKDTLTELPNRVMFRDRAEVALSAAKRRGHSASIMLMDLDRFKEINDTLGHHTGDEVLIEIARRLQRGLREADTVARLGGDEFAIIVDAPKEDALRIGEQLRRFVAEPLEIAGVAFALDASLGIVTYPEDGPDFETLMQRADVAMYQAKGSENRVVSYSSEGDDNSLARLTMAVGLRRAIESGAIEVLFQPQYSASTGAMTGVEALARWTDDDGNAVSPDEFIPVAEQTGLIVPLTLHVLEVSVRELARWRARGVDLRVAINLSARVLTRGELPEHVAEIAARWHVEPSALVMEITESMVASDPRTTIPVVEELAATGATISIDDFGTGFSSLEYLKLLPVGELKIDRSFVTAMQDDERNVAIVRSAVELGHRLGLRVIAEGVENQATRAHLTLMACDAFQGFLFSRAVRSAEIEALHAAGIGETRIARSA
jgi:diguanylate cyclase (GGDEF)-like protein